MKKLWIVPVLCFTIVCINVHAQEATDIKKADTVKEAGKFKFKEETHDFGEIMDGPQVECDFEFKNVGKSPIVITEAHASCGCTVPNWPKEPITPKHKGVIQVTYNTNGRVGPINKDVVITSNAEQSTMKLHIAGMVKPRPENNKPESPPPPPAK